MAKDLLVRILGDPSDLSRSLKTATAETETFGQKFGAGLKAAGLVAGAGIAVAGAAIFESVKAAEQAQQSTARLDKAFQNVGLSAQGSAKLIDQAESSSRKLGFTDQQTQAALGSLITATGSVSKSMNELSVAQDLARFKSTSLENATKMLVMAQTGSARAAKQLGISVIPVTTAYDALKATMGKNETAAQKLELAHAKLQDKMATGNAIIDAVRQKVEGQGLAFANTAAGGMAQFNAQFDRIKVQVGDVFLPALTRAAGGLADFMGKFGDASGIQAKFKVILDGIVHVAQGAGQQIAEALFSAFNASAAGAGNRNTSGAADAMAKNLQVQLKLSISKINWGDVGSSITEGIYKAVVKGLPALYRLNIVVSAALGQAMAGAFTKAADALTKEVNKELADIAKQLGNGAKAVGSAAESMGKGIVSGVEKGLSGLTSAVTTALGKVLSAIKKLPGEIVAVFAGLPALMAGIGASMMGGLVSGIEGSIGRVIGAAQGVVSKAKSALEFWKSPPDAYGRWIGGLVIDGIGDGMTKATPHAVTAAVGSIGSIKNGISTAINGINDAVRSRIQQVIKTIEGPWGAEIVINGHVTTHITGPGPAVAGPSVLGDIAQINALDATQQANQQAITDYTNTYVDTSFATPGYNIGMTPAQVYALSGNQQAAQAPAAAAAAVSTIVSTAISNAIHPGMQFEMGGRVPGNLGQAQLAIVHGGETVIPYGGGIASTPIVVNVNGWVGNDQQIALKILEQFQRIYSRNH